MRKHTHLHHTARSGKPRSQYCVKACADDFNQQLKRLRPTVLKDGDILLLQTGQNFKKDQVEKFHARWTERFGDRFPVAILAGDWNVNILRKGGVRAL
jgi:hypothetical protein